MDGTPDIRLKMGRNWSEMKMLEVLACPIEVVAPAGIWRPHL